MKMKMKMWKVLKASFVALACLLPLLNVHNHIGIRHPKLVVRLEYERGKYYEKATCGD